MLGRGAGFDESNFAMRGIGIRDFRVHDGGV
jgi:hypothetical protein